MLSHHFRDLRREKACFSIRDLHGDECVPCLLLGERGVWNVHEFRVFLEIICWNSDDLCVLASFWPSHDLFIRCHDRVL